jgi:hypothetical protein
MSSISSLTGTGQSVSAYFSKLFKKHSGASGSASATTSTSDAASAAGIFLGQNSGSSHKSGGLYKQIEQSVTSALQGAQKSGSSADPNETIENAIESVLSQSPDAGQSEAEGAADPNAAPLDSTDSSFLSALQGAGVNQAQFQQDVHSAFAEAQNGQINYASAFKAPNLGSLVNTIA